MRTVRLLDLFCGAGGAAVGYHRAGFDVVGVDIAPQPRYPFPFIQADALQYLKAHGAEYDAIHASPPCQHYSRTGNMSHINRQDSPDLIPTVRHLLERIGRPYIIENVTGSPLSGVTLCGLMFDLRVFRHRIFESNVLLMQPQHKSHRGYRIGAGGYCCLSGHGDGGRGKVNKYHRRVSTWSLAVDIHWMTRSELCQAIPPAYTEYLGQQLIRFCA